eukprot:scaffold29145_cov90-Isochrysis_galbana.AAC.3
MRAESTAVPSMLPSTTLPVSKCAAYLEFERKRPWPAGGNVVRGVRWAPDGSCLLTASEDNVLRIFNLPPTVAREAYDAACGAAADRPGCMADARASELEPVLRIDEGESVYDCCWYPLMDSSDRLSCCVLSSCRDHPIRLWDAYDGSLRAAYVGYNHLDELAPAYSLAFEPGGRRIYAGC